MKKIKQNSSGKISLIAIALFFFCIISSTAYASQCNVAGWYNQNWFYCYNVSVPGNSKAIAQINITNTVCINNTACTRLIWNSNSYPFEWSNGNTVIDFINNASENSNEYELYCSLSCGEGDVSGGVFVYKDDFNDGVINSTIEYVLQGSGAVIETNGALRITTPNIDNKNMYVNFTGSAFDRTISSYYLTWTLSHVFLGLEGHYGFAGFFKQIHPSNHTLYEYIAIGQYSGGVYTERYKFSSPFYGQNISAIGNVNVTSYNVTMVVNKNENTTMMVRTNSLNVSTYREGTNWKKGDFAYWVFDGGSGRQTYIFIDNLYVSSREFNVTEGIKQATLSQSNFITPSNISLIYPTPNLILNKFTGQIDFNITPVMNSTIINCTLWTNETGNFIPHGKVDSPIGYAISTIRDTDGNLNVSGNIKWAAQCCLSDGSCSFSTNQTMHVDREAPTITFNNNNFFLSTNLTQIQSINLSNKLINITFTDINKVNNYNIFIYNSTNNLIQTLTNNSVNLSTFQYETYINMTGEQGFYLVNISVCDTFDQVNPLNCKERLYRFYVTHQPFIYIRPNIDPFYTIFSNQSLFLQLNITGEIRNHTVFFLYNSTGSEVENKTTYNSGNGSYIYSQTFSDLQDTIYYVNMSHYNSLGGITYSNTFEIRQLTFDNCSVGSRPVLNISIYDEQQPSIKLSATMEVQAEYWFMGDKSISQNISYLLSGSDYYEFCIGSENGTLNINAYLKYTTENGFTERWYLNNQSLGNVTYKLDVYNFNTTSGISTLRLTTQDKLTYRVKPLITMKLQRLYTSESIWRTVQVDKSGDDGLGLFNIIESTADYRLVFLDEQNNVLKITNNLKFGCTSSICDVIYLLQDYQETSSNPNNLQFTAVYNNQTNNITVDWTDALETTHMLRVVVTKENKFPPLIICDIQKNSSSGQIICPLGHTEGAVLMNIYSSASPERPVFVEIIDILVSKLADFLPGGSQEGYVWTGFIVMVMIGIGIFSPVGVVISAVLGVFISYVLGLLSLINLSGIVVIAVVTFVISFKLNE